MQSLEGSVYNTRIKSNSTNNNKRTEYYKH